MNESNPPRQMDGVVTETMPASEAPSIGQQPDGSRCVLRRLNEDGSVTVGIIARPPTDRLMRERAGGWKMSKKVGSQPRPRRPPPNRVAGKVQETFRAEGFRTPRGQKPWHDR